MLVNSILKWILAALFSVIIPAIAFDILLLDWKFDVEPPWGWATISMIPLVSLTLLVLQDRWLSKFSRPACAILISHAAIMIVSGLADRYRVVGVSVFVDLLLIAAVSPAAFGVIPLPRFSRATLFWIALLFGVGFPAGLANGVVVMWRAEALAGDRPYCIQYASQTDAFAYEPARTLFDLSALKMQQRLDYTAGFTGAQFVFQRHAVLVFEEGQPRLFSWSYRHEDFLDDVNNWPGHRAPEVFCTPRKHYARHLPIWWRAPVGNIEFSISGRRFSIPEGYRPRQYSDAVVDLPPFGDARWLGSSLVGNALVFDAVSPDFDAYDPSRNANWQYHYDIIIAGEDAVDLSSVLKRRIASYEKPDIQPEFNLSRIQQRDLRKFPKNVLYAEYDDAGTVIGLLNCDPRYGPRLLPRNFFDPNCRYMFVSDGLYFSLRTEGASQWQAIKQRLAHVLASFELNQPDQTRQH